MLLYAHRDEAPFHTRVVAATAAAVSLCFPPELTYEAEGSRKHVRCADAGPAGRLRTCRIVLADDLETFIRLRMDDLSSVLELRVRRRDRWTAALGVAVGVVTAFLVQQAIEGRPPG